MCPYFLVGTSGWNYGHWRGVFYPENLTPDRWLAYYARYFNAVELNVTFYRQVRESTFEKWRLGTPQDFSFVAKGSRFITHIKRIKGVKESVGLFFENALALKKKLACVLWQFPPSFKKDLCRLEIFLKILDRFDVRQAFEFRHMSWFDESVYALLKKHKACLCIAHSGRHYPCVRQATADFLYLRFHGEDRYSSDYSDDELREWATFARKSQRKDILAFFNNDAHGYAVENALAFSRLLAGHPLRRNRREKG